MTRDFDRLITKAAPVVPDSGPSRRVARALLHERMRRHAHQRNRRGRWGVSLAAGLAFLWVIGGQIGQLGSDSFELELKSFTDSGGRSVPVAVSKTRGIVVNTLPDMTAEDIQEFQQQILLDEGIIVDLHGFSFDGSTPYWQVTRLVVTNGTSHTVTGDPVDLSVENGRLPRSAIPFFSNLAAGFMAEVNGGRIPATDFATVSACGINFKVKQWQRHYPEVGLVTYYRGHPVD